MTQARLLFGSALLLSLMLQPASAGFIDGNELYSQSSKAQPVFCQAFIMGVAEVMTKETDVMKSNDLMICMPKDTVTKQLIDIVTTALRDDPAHRTMPAHYLVMDALMKAWPCQQ